MNGSRQNPNSRGERSLDALNRTIDSLEARIEGLLKVSGREPRIDSDLLAEIRQRQRALGAGRERQQRGRDQENQRDGDRRDGNARDGNERDNQRNAPIAEGRAVPQEPRAPAAAAPARPPLSPASPPEPRIATSARPVEPREPVREKTTDLRYEQESGFQALRDAQQRREPRRDTLDRQPYSSPVEQHNTDMRRAEQPPMRPVMTERAPMPERPQPQQQRARPSETGVQELVGALQALRQDLKRDISEGISREMEQMRSEIHAIRELSADRRLPDELRDELVRLALSIEEMNHRTPSDTGVLQQELDELRHLMDGLAREDSVQRMELRWAELEDRFQELDTHGIQRELIALAYRIDGLKSELVSLPDSEALHALEDKVLMMAAIVEDLGARPTVPETVNAQFSQLDNRLDEISRAVASTARQRSYAEEQAAFQRLEDRLGQLTQKFDSLVQVQDAQRLEDRLEEVISGLGRNNPSELTGYLEDLSRRIDTMSHEQPSHQVISRLDDLAERLDEIQHRQTASPRTGPEDAAFERLEQRLDDIARRLSDTAHAPQHDNRALMQLEAQIADLTALFRASPRETAALPAALDQRMSSIENYMATSDEYILEAARQAAESVIQAYQPQAGSAGASAADNAQFVALAEDLRHLEQLARASDERSQTTFDSLHRTLVQIAGRLDKMEDRFSTSTAPFAAAEPPVLRPPMAAPARPEPAAQPEPHILARAAEELMNDTAPAFMDREETELALEAQVVEEKTGFLSSLSKRLKPQAKAKAKAAEPDTRALIDPAPSIDPVDTVVDDHANDLLEPGSGKPDVRKILERVRASQAANQGIGSGNERVDYIAAARRAAKAAALETDPLKASAPGKARAATASKGKAKAAATGANGPKEIFNRHRRPILMAVGAILLALMTMPLINSLTGGSKIITPPPPATRAQPALPPQAPAAEAPAKGQDAAQHALNDTGTGMDSSQAQPADGASETAQSAASQASLAAGSAAGNETANAPAATMQASAPTTAVSASSLSPAASGEASGQTGAPTDALNAKIEVPASVSPKSLADAATSGDPQALFEIGARFTEGRAGVEVDTKQAAQWYELAAERGFAPAQYRLGSLYEKGNGVPRDMARAMALYKSAADAGNAGAMHNLAVLEASGAAGTADYKAAVDWFIKAADLGITDSQFNLAILYARGNGTPQNLEESYKWFAIAAKGGDKDAAQKRDEVGRALKPDQLARAKATAEAWTAKALDPKANVVNIPDAWSGKTEATTGSIDMGKAIRNIQAILNKTGYDAGQPDGLMGKKTIAAIKAFQKSNGLTDDGNITEELVRKLLEQHQAKAKSSTG